MNTKDKIILKPTYVQCCILFLSSQPFSAFRFSSEIVSKSLESLAEQSLAAKFLQNPSMQLHLQVHDFPKLSPKWISFWWLTHISRRTLQTWTTDGKLKSKTFGPINFGAFGVILAD